MESNEGNDLLQFYEYELCKMHDEKKENAFVIQQQAATIAELTANNEALKQKHAQELSNIRKEHAAQLADRIERIESEKQGVIYAVRMAHEGSAASYRKRNHELEEELRQVKTRFDMW